MKRPLSNFDAEELADLFKVWGFRPAHATTILRAYYHCAGSPDLSSLEIGNALRARIEADLALRGSSILRRSDSEDGTVKLLVAMAGGGAVESVLMPSYDPRRSAGCVSSQIGCAMGCDFCASTKSGLERNLESGEIVEQFLHLKEEAIRVGRRLTRLVFMGMGEPMQNLPNVISAIRRIGGNGMGELGWRQITVSTVGIVPGIEKLADSNLNVHLAVSLHAPDEETRARIIPAARRYGSREVMEAAKRYQARTRRIVTIEYCMLEGVNDSAEQARLLASLMAGFRAHVNLIPYNSIGTGLSGVVYRTPSRERMGRFMQILRDAGVVAHFRRTRGDDVNAACGQLRQTALAQA